MYGPDIAGHTLTVMRFQFCWAAHGGLLIVVFITLRTSSARIELQALGVMRFVLHVNLIPTHILHSGTFYRTKLERRS